MVGSAGRAGDGKITSGGCLYRHVWVHRRTETQKVSSQHKCVKSDWNYQLSDLIPVPFSQGGEKKENLHFPQFSY